MNGPAGSEVRFAPRAGSMNLRPLRARTPCCNATVRCDRLASVGDSASRKCRVCGACYIATVTPSHIDGLLRLEWRQTRRPTRRPQDAGSDRLHTKRTEDIVD